MNILGIGGLLGHDGNAALISNNKIIAASQEERFTRIKHDALFPRNAIDDCLQIANLTYADIDVVVLAEKPLQVYINTQLGRTPSLFLTRISNSKLVKKLTLSVYEKEIIKLFPNAKIDRKSVV